MTSADDAAVHNNTAKHRFELQVADHLAVAEYWLKGNTITFTHTGVPPELEGHGVGARLVKFALDESRSKGYRVVPLCPFVAQYIRRHPEYADLVS